MDGVTIIISKALICFSSMCHPVLLGPGTQPGEYKMSILYTEQPGYGGDVLMYSEDSKRWWAIHRTFTKSKRDRSKLYHGTTAAQRRDVSLGCPNVEPAVYEELKKNHRFDTLTIVK